MTHLLNNQLRNPIPNLDFKVRLAQVRQYNADLPTVVRIDNTRHGINTMLSRESRARSHTSVCTIISNLLNWPLSAHSHVPAGTAMEISVSTLALPRAGITTSRALYRSWPAAKALPLVGARAASLRSWTWRACSAAAAAAMLGAIGAGGWRAMARGVGVEVPESEARGSVDGWLREEGSMTFVRFGRGDEGREGGSWVGTGVCADMIVRREGLRVKAVSVSEDACGGAEGRVARLGAVIGQVRVPRIPTFGESSGVEFTSEPSRVEARCHLSSPSCELLQERQYCRLSTKRLPTYCPEQHPFPAASERVVCMLSLRARRRFTKR